MRPLCVCGGFLLVLVAGASGCTGARCLSVRPDGGGVVAIPANSNSWPTYYRKSAEELMKQKCPQGYVIDHEEEVKVGQSVAENTSSNENNVTRSRVTRDLTEWHIYYHPKDAVGVPAPAVRVPVYPVSRPPAGLPQEPVPVAQ